MSDPKAVKLNDIKEQLSKLMEVEASAIDLQNGVVNFITDVDKFKNPVKVNALRNMMINQLALSVDWLRQMTAKVSALRLEVVRHGLDVGELAGSEDAADEG